MTLDVGSIIVMVLGALFGAMLTYLVNLLFQRSRAEKAGKETAQDLKEAISEAFQNHQRAYHGSDLMQSLERAIKQHEDVWHKDSMYSFFEGEMEKHEKKCGARQEIDEVKAGMNRIDKALVYIVKEMGGDPHDCGLL